MILVSAVFEMVFMLEICLKCFHISLRNRFGNMFQVVDIPKSVERGRFHKKEMLKAVLATVFIVALNLSQQTILGTNDWKKKSPGQQVTISLMFSVHMFRYRKLAL